MKLDDHLETNPCEHISRMLARISGKWTVLIVGALSQQPMRFNTLRRTVGEISQKVLASTLRDLEENGFILRTVMPTNPPQVEYALTSLGQDFVTPVQVLADWAVENSARIDAARSSYQESRAGNE
ncbi:winged helix-turn-helix transcriptional regulator (plasmid) [Agrobacterium sp. rho-8.1]|nr:helix-turn-helix domain-containing protein [Agrobacterium sp. rho-8.1]